MKLILFLLTILISGNVFSMPFLFKDNETFKIQLQGTINYQLNYDIFFIDGFDNKELIPKLHAEGKKVICYMSAGSYENWRKDKDQFSDEVLGKPLAEWPGERWIDIRSENVKNIMKERIKTLSNYGCDGIDPDNVNLHIQHSGFELTKKDLINYNKFLATEIKNNNMIVGLKNTQDLIPELIDYYDFAVNEECHIFKECGLYKYFIINNKPVFNIEYDYYYNDNSKLYNLCFKSKNMKMNTVVTNIKLNGQYYRSCSKINL